MGYLDRNDAQGAREAYVNGLLNGTWTSEDSRRMLAMQDDPTELLALMKVANRDPNVAGALAKMAATEALKAPPEPVRPWLKDLGYERADEDSRASAPDLTMAEIRAEITALTAEIEDEWRGDEDELREDMTIGLGAHQVGGGKFDPSKHPRTHGRFANNGGRHKPEGEGAAKRHSAKARSTPEAKAAKAERAKGHAERATNALGAIEKRRATSEAKHAQAIEATKTALAEAKAARDLAKKDPSAKNLQAWERATQRAVKARAAVDKHAEAATKHAELHEKAKTTHALAQSKLKEAERAAGAGDHALPQSRDIMGIGFERIGGGHSEAGAEVSSAAAPVAGHKSHISETDFRLIGERRAAEVKAAAEAAKAAEPKPTGTTSLWKPTSVAQEAAIHEARVKQGGGSDGRRAGESWYDYDRRQGAARQAASAREHSAAAAERDRYVVPPGSIPFPEQRAELPRAVALPKAAELVGFGSLPSKKKRKDELRADEAMATAEALADVAKRHPSPESISRAREAIAHARELAVKLRQP